MKRFLINLGYSRRKIKRKSSNAESERKRESPFQSNSNVEYEGEKKS